MALPLGPFVVNDETAHACISAWQHISDASPPVTQRLTLARPAVALYDARVRHTGPSPAKRLLFVCTGNICRSPLAEAIFRHRAEEAGLGADFEVDSAGTHGYHEGEPADARARRLGAARGVAVTSFARQVRGADFERFDLILAMDRGHLRELRGRCPVPLRDRIRLMRDFGEPPGGDVPDPYYSGDEAFEEVFDLLDVCCRGLLAELRR